MISKKEAMRIWIFAFWFVVVLAPSVSGEAWDFSCTEAVSLLKVAQDRVVQKHDQLQEAKFSLRHVPKKFDGCRRNQRGFDGGKIYCVTHQLEHGTILKDILVAQRSLNAAQQDFDRHVQGVVRACPASHP
jgi:hypothetical protein